MDNTTSKGLTGNTLKYIAIITMLIDHIAWLFIPFNSLLGQSMHIIGRTTAPIMCFFIAEGYYYTKNVKKYALRLGIFAAISHFPFIYMEFGRLNIPMLYTSVIYTLFLGLLTLCVYYKINNKTLKTILIIFICILASFGDWPIFAVLWVLNFSINRDNIKQRNKWFIIINTCFIIISILLSLKNNSSWYRSLFQSGVFLALPLISLYNGNRGKGGKFNKWVFYIFYPLHLIILGIIKYKLI